MAKINYDKNNINKASERKERNMNYVYYAEKYEYKSCFSSNDISSSINCNIY